MDSASQFLWLASLLWPERLSGKTVSLSLLPVSTVSTVLLTALSARIMHADGPKVISGRFRLEQSAGAGQLSLLFRKHGERIRLSVCRPNSFGQERAHKRAHDASQRVERRLEKRERERKGAMQIKRCGNLSSQLVCRPAPFPTLSPLFFPLDSTLLPPVSIRLSNWPNSPKV